MELDPELQKAFDDEREFLRTMLPLTTAKNVGALQQEIIKRMALLASRIDFPHKFKL